MVSEAVDQFSFECNRIGFLKELCHSLKNLENLQKQDSEVNAIIKQVENQELNQMFLIKKGILFRHVEKGDIWQLVIPEVLIIDLINCVHAKLGHPGCYKTTAYLS